MEVQLVQEVTLEEVQNDTQQDTDHEVLVEEVTLSDVRGDMEQGEVMVEQMTLSEVRAHLEDTHDEVTVEEVILHEDAGDIVHLMPVDANNLNHGDTDREVRDATDQSFGNEEMVFMITSEVMGPDGQTEYTLEETDEAAILTHELSGITAMDEDDYMYDTERSTTLSRLTKREFLKRVDEQFPTESSVLMLREKLANDIRFGDRTALRGKLMVRASGRSITSRSRYVNDCYVFQRYIDGDKLMDIEGILAQGSPKKSVIDKTPKKPLVSKLSTATNDTKSLQKTSIKKTPLQKTPLQKTVLVPMSPPPVDVIETPVNSRPKRTCRSNKKYANSEDKNVSSTEVDETGDAETPEELTEELVATQPVSRTTRKSFLPDKDKMNKVKITEMKAQLKGVQKASSNKTTKLNGQIKDLKSELSELKDIIRIMKEEKESQQNAATNQSFSQDDDGPDGSNEDFELDDQLPDITYEISEELFTIRGGRKLVGSDGNVYIVKRAVEKNDVWWVWWRCERRFKNHVCTAQVLQQGDEFHTMAKGHIHDQFPNVKNFIEGLTKHDMLRVDENNIYQADVGGGVLRNFPHTCEQCERYFVYRKDLEKHGRDYHGAAYTCNLCERNFKDHHMFKEHMFVVHTNTKSFGCEICGKAFHLKKFLQKHVKTHDKTRPRSFICPECGKGYFSMDILTKHIHTHSEHTHLCTFCGKLFKTKGQLRNHINIHTRQRVVRCPHCPKDFTHSTHLIMHVRRHHTGERPYPCGFCDKRFISRVEAKEHECTHTGMPRRKQRKEMAAGLIPSNVEAGSGARKPKFLQPVKVRKGQPITVKSEPDRLIILETNDGDDGVEDYASNVYVTSEGEVTNMVAW